ncbi:MAG: MarR family transcriptional regulator [Gemmatimonadetes bacterium]|nr:MarR family transcriptional regulator [Gemmatimonadota bacterium]
MKRARGPAPATAPRAARRSPSHDAADRLHSAAIHLLRRVRREDAGSGLSAPHLSALSVIVFRGPLTLGELAHAEQVRPPTITRIVAALEASGLATRSARPTDRRITIVSATAKGARLLDEGRRRRIAAIADELARLQRRDLATIERALDLLERIVGPPQRAVPARNAS